MLPSDFRSKQLIYACQVFFLMLGIFYLVPASAQTYTVPTATDVIHNVSSQLPNLMRLVTAVAYVMGMYFVIQGVMKLKHVGESRTQMSHEHSIGEPLIYILVGVLLLYLPSSVQIGLSSFWTEPNPYGYVVEKNEWSDFIQDCFLVVQLFGTIAFIRGVVKLSHVGGRGGHQGGLGGALAHIIGGLLCINMYQFVQVVFVTLGIQLH